MYVHINNRDNYTCSNIIYTINKSLIKDETEVLEHNHRSMKKDEMGTKCASKLGRPVGLTCIVIDSWWDFQESSTSQFLTNTPCCIHPSTKMEGKCIIAQTILKEKKYGQPTRSLPLPSYTYVLVYQGHQRLAIYPKLISNIDITRRQMQGN